jgi:mannan endo-1,4-beta-mannosidase
MNIFALNYFLRESDAYVRKYKLPITNCMDAVNQPTAFYSDPSAQNDFDNRIRHILAHQNPFFGNRPWSSIFEAILSFDIENESQGHMVQVNDQWLCARAAVMKRLLSNGILVSTGGGTDFTSSLAISNFQCQAIDVVAIHTYDLSSLSSNFQTGCGFIINILANK